MDGTTASAVWASIVKNYDMILGAQLSNSFIILIALSESNRPLTATEISKTIASNTNGKIFRVPATLQDSLQKRLNREGYVDSERTGGQLRYSITTKGQELLRGWRSFLLAYRS